jgi:NAD-dependent deacetylase
VVLFGEPLDQQLFAAARKVIRDCDVVLVIGTSNLIYPAAELPRYAMKRRKFVVEINPQATPLSSWVSARVESSASVGLVGLMRPST